MPAKKKKIKNSIAVMGLALSLYLNSNSVSASGENIFIDYSIEKNVDNYLDINNKEDYIIQGVSPIKDKIFITAYNPNGKKSKVFIYNDDYSYFKDVLLYNAAHVGGITYDDKHDNIWITDIHGTISAYKYNDFITKDIVTPIIKQCDILDDDMINIWGNKACAYITYYKNSLYVGNFNISDRSYLKKLNINTNGTINIDDSNKQKFIGSVQGISFFEKEGNTYLCVSSSFGRFTKSQIRILKYDESIDNLDITKCMYMECPPMIEQIDMNNNGRLISVFESNSKKYIGKTKNSNDLIETNMNDVIEENIKLLK